MAKTSACSPEMVNLLLWLIDNPPALNAQKEQYETVAQLVCELLPQLTEYLLSYHTSGDAVIHFRAAIKDVYTAQSNPPSPSGRLANTTAALRTAFSL